MKNLIIKIALKALFIIGGLSLLAAQERNTIALVSIDTRNLQIDNTTMSNLIRLELEKIDRYEVLDKYDVGTTLRNNNINEAECFGKNSLIEAGKLLKADKMLSGSAELFGDKIIIILRLIDVHEEIVEKTSVMEYLNAQGEIQIMAMISLNDLLGVKNDPHLVDLLIDYNLPITTRKTTVSLNGPRMGASFTMGHNSQRLRDSKENGGYNMFPVSSIFGYQYEKQYMSSGDFQALVEVIGVVSGLESGNFIPSITFMNGFRFNKQGYEFGLGPVLRVVKTEEGFFDDGNWVLTKEVSEVPAGTTIHNLIDRRGVLRPSMGLVVAVGKTFRSGYLNVPVNLYYSPIKDGSIIGVTFGFNTTKKPTFD